MIAGLDEVTDGEITIGDRVVTDEKPKDRDIAMVFQNYALYPHMTVEQNIGFGMRLRRAPKPLVRQRVTGAAEVLALLDYLARKPADLSGGQRQRVAIGRAMVREPQAWTPSCGCRCGPSWPGCTSSSAPRSCTSPTTRSRR
jgi:ABC-type sugar transport system ATPase subunit